jgi:hypothetical protein
MTSVPPKRPPAQTRPRRVHLILRDGVAIDCGIYLTDGQFLAPYLGSRKGGWVNIVNAVWRNESETHHHAVLQSDHILIASGAEADVPVYFATTGAVPRDVDIALEDGRRVQGQLHLAEKQRMSDYLSGCGKFMPVIGAKLVPADTLLGDIALNSGCVKAVRDAKVFAGEAPSPAEAQAQWGGIRRSLSMQMPVNRDVINTTDASFEVLTPGRVPDRRVSQATPYVSPPTQQPPSRIPVVDEASFTAAERERAERLARHWLVQVAESAGLAAPDPRPLSDTPTLEDVWRGIAQRNDMADVELAIQVAQAYRLEFANLEEVSPDALRIVPEKVARRYGFIPVKIEDKTLTIAISDPTSHEIEQQLGFLTKLNPRLVVAAPSDIRSAVDWHYGHAKPGK